MKHNVWQANWKLALKELVRRNLVAGAEAEALIQNYDLLRRCETALRRWRNSKVDGLPSGAEQQERLSKRLGYKSGAIFLEQYNAARAGIHRFYEARLKSLVS
jgi:glutamine synthetase adenylyltransferase